MKKLNKQRTVASPLVEVKVSIPTVFMLTRSQDLRSSSSLSHANLTRLLAFSLSDTAELGSVSQNWGSSFLLDVFG